MLLMVLLTLILAFACFVVEGRGLGGTSCKLSQQHVTISKLCRNLIGPKLHKTATIIP